MYEDSKRCWICHRTEARLRYELPDIMWSIKGDPFRIIYFSGNVIDVDKRRGTDVWEENTYVRPGLPDDMSSLYDASKDAMILVKRHELPICPLCSALMLNKKAILQGSEPSSRPRSVRQTNVLDILDDPNAFSEQERIVNNIWTFKINEVQKMEGEFPQAEFRTLLIFYQSDLTAPVAAAIVATRSGMQVPQVGIAFKNIAQKYPEVGDYFEDSAVFVFKKELNVKKRLEELIQVYLKNPENLAYLQK
jgi:hypothetical protein